MRIVKWLIFLVYFLNQFLLFVAVLAPFVNPRQFWPPAFVALFFKVFFIMHLVFLAWFIYRRKRRWMWAAITAVLLCIPALQRTVAFSPAEVWNSKEGYKIMSYNVHNFGWYEDSTMVNGILEAIKEASPDIVCLQEYYSTPQRQHQMISRFCDDMGYAYYWEYTPDGRSSRWSSGMAIYSKVPFYNFTPIAFAHTTNGAFAVDVPLGEDTLRVINVHFQSIGLREEEYTLPLPEAEQEPGMKWALAKASLGKFMRAFRKRSYQAQLVREAVQQSPHKVIVCGDFNDSPVSYLHYQLTREMEDTYLETNIGLGSSFAGKIPFLRIDYILASPEIEVNRTRVVREGTSDHYPLMCWFHME